MTLLTELFFTIAGLVVAAAFGGTLGYIALFPGDHQLRVRDRIWLAILSAFFLVGGAAAVLVDW